MILDLMPPPAERRRSVAARERGRRPELREVYSTRLKDLWRKPGYRARQLIAMRAAYCPEVLERRSKTRREKNAERRATLALIACGKPTWRRCSFCKRWDDPENLYIGRKGCKHRACANAYARKANPRRAA